MDNMIKCACGCGQERPKFDKWGYPKFYINGHNRKGLKSSQKTIDRMRKSMKGKIHSEETKRKISESKKGSIPWNRGILMPEYVKLKISKANKGRHHTQETKEKISKNNARYWLGRKRSAEEIKKFSDSHKGQVGWMKGLKAEDDERVKRFIELGHHAIRGKPNKIEKKLTTLIQQHNLSFNYVGNGKIWFQGQTQDFNPDFLSKNPKHIIELFGDYWHRNTQQKDEERIQTYAKYGYKTLIIWEHELKESNEVIHKIKAFLNS